jgi:REP element-mobilizing transposase RayT
VSDPQAVPSGVPPVLAEKITRRHLPHWQLAGATYFLTWRCASGFTLAEADRDIVLAAIRHWDTIRWDVYVAVVMPDHVHVLACPLPKGDGRWELGELLHSVKSFSAYAIGKHRKQTAAKVTPELAGRASAQSFSVWQDERYDRWMRDDDEFAEKWAYIVENPAKAGLVSQVEPYRWLYQKPTGEAGGGTGVPPVRNQR